MQLFLQSPDFTLHTHLLSADCLQPLYLGLETKGDHDLVSPVEELPPRRPTQPGRQIRKPPVMMPDVSVL